MRTLFRSPNFRRLFVGQFAGMTGDSVMLLVLAVWVKTLTGSSGLAGTVILAVSAPSLLSPLLGWGVDRVRRRPFLIWTNLGSAAVLLPLLAVRTGAELWIIFAVAVCYGVSFNLNSAGVAALLKNLVEDEQLAEANSMLRTVREGLRLVGPLAGTGLYAVTGARTVVVVGIVAFLVAAAALAAIRLSEERPRPAAQHWVEQAGAGLRHLLQEPELRRGALAVSTAFLVFGAVNAGVFAYVDQGLHRPAAFVSVLLTAMGVGSILGAVLAPLLIRRLGELGAIAAGIATLAAGLGPLAYPAVWLGLCAAPAAGVGVSLVAVAFATLIQRRTSADLMGRVSTATDLVIGVPQTCSIAVGAVLVSVVDYRWMFLVIAAGLVVVAAALWRSRRPLSPSRTVVAPVLNGSPSS